MSATIAVIILMTAVLTLQVLHKEIDKKLVGRNDILRPLQLLSYFFIIFIIIYFCGKNSWSPMVWTDHLFNNLWGVDLRVENLLVLATIGLVFSMTEPNDKNHFKKILALIAALICVVSVTALQMGIFLFVSLYFMGQTLEKNLNVVFFPLVVLVFEGYWLSINGESSLIKGVDTQVRENFVFISLLTYSFFATSSELLAKNKKSLGLRLVSTLLCFYVYSNIINQYNLDQLMTSFYGITSIIILFSSLWLRNSKTYAHRANEHLSLIVSQCFLASMYFGHSKTAIYPVGVLLVSYLLEKSVGKNWQQGILNNLLGVFCILTVIGLPFSWYSLLLVSYGDSQVGFDYTIYIALMINISIFNFFYLREKTSYYLKRWEKGAVASEVYNFILISLFVSCFYAFELNYLHTQLFYWSEGYIYNESLKNGIFTLILGAVFFAIPILLCPVKIEKINFIKSFKRIQHSSTNCVFSIFSTLIQALNDTVLSLVKFLSQMSCSLTSSFANFLKDIVVISSMAALNSLSILTKNLLLLVIVLWMAFSIMLIWRSGL